METSRTEVADGPVDGDKLDPAIRHGADSFLDKTLDPRHGHAFGAQLFGTTPGPERPAQASAIARSHETSRRLSIIAGGVSINVMTVSDVPRGPGSTVVDQFLRWPGNGPAAGFRPASGKRAMGNCRTVRHQVAIGRRVLVEEIFESGDLGEQVFLPVFDLPLTG